MKIKHTLQNETMKLSHFNENHVSTSIANSHRSFHCQYSYRRCCEFILRAGYGSVQLSDKKLTLSMEALGEANILLAFSVHVLTVK
jgi:hypothetical protein